MPGLPAGNGWVAGWAWGVMGDGVGAAQTLRMVSEYRVMCVVQKVSKSHRPSTAAMNSSSNMSTLAAGPCSRRNLQPKGGDVGHQRARVEYPGVRLEHAVAVGWRPLSSTC